jgi:flagellar assembly factor FliW
MATTQTRRFGLLEYDPNAVLDFPAGLPGYENQNRFILMEKPAHAPIMFLQSLESPDLCFLAAPIHLIDPAYELAIIEEDLRRLKLDDTRQPAVDANVVCLALLSAAENGPLTANLLAPVVINVAARLAVQAVRMDAGYSHQHPLPAREASCS